MLSTYGDPDELPLPAFPSAEGALSTLRAAKDVGLLEVFKLALPSLVVRSAYSGAISRALRPRRSLRPPYALAVGATAYSVQNIMLDLFGLVLNRLFGHSDNLTGAASDLVTRLVDRVGPIIQFLIYTHVVQNNLVSHVRTYGDGLVSATMLLLHQNAYQLLFNGFVDIMKDFARWLDSTDPVSVAEGPDASTVPLIPINSTTPLNTTKFDGSLQLPRVEDELLRQQSRFVENYPVSSEWFSGAIPKPSVGVRIYSDYAATTPDPTTSQGPSPAYGTTGFTRAKHIPGSFRHLDIPVI